MSALPIRLLCLLSLFVGLLAPGAVRAQNWSWATTPTPGTAGSISESYIHNAIDAAGNELVAASFSGTITIGTTTLTGPTSGSGTGTFVAKRSAAGAWLWAVAGGNGSVTGLSVDAAGNAYVAVAIWSSGVTFGTTVLPATTDDRIAIAKVSAAGQWQWASVASSSTWIDGQRLAVDAAGNAYLTGAFGQTATFGTTTLTTTAIGDRDAFVAKINTSGVWQWANRAGGSGDESGSGVAVDATGNVYVTGRFSSSSLTFGATTLNHSLPSPLNYSFDVFVAKLSAAGNWLWAIKRGTADYDLSNQIAVGPAGDIRLTRFSFVSTSMGNDRVLQVESLTPSGGIQWTLAGPANSNLAMPGLVVDAAGATYVAGSYMFTPISFGNLALPAPTGGWVDLVVAKATAAGTWEWAQRGGGSGREWAQSLALDPSGRPCLAGFLSSTDAVFGTIATPAVGDNDLLLARLDAAGTWQATTRLGSAAGSSTGQAVARDAAGNTYVTGRFRGTFTFGSTVLTSMNSTADLFVAKLSPAGAWLWAVRAGGGGDDSGTGIAVTSTGVVYVTGTFAGSTASFNSIVLTNGGGTDAFVARLSATGAWQWARRAGGAGADAATDLTLDASGNAYVAGSFTGSGLFGSVTLTSAGPSDAFLARISSSGVWGWAVRAGGSGGATTGTGVALSGSNLYLTGAFQSGTAAFGSTTLTNASAGTYDVFLARLTTAGAWQWAQRAGGTDDDRAMDVAVDGTGNAYLTGYFTSQTPAFGSFTLTNATTHSENGYDDHDDIFVAKVDPTGAWLWASQAGAGEDCTYLRPGARPAAGSGGSTNTPLKDECDPFIDQAYSIAVDAAGTAYIVGLSDREMGMSGSWSLNVVGPALPSYFVAALTPAGAWQWVMEVNAGPRNYLWPGPAAISVDANGVPALTGCFAGSARFNATALNGSYLFDQPYVAQLAPAAPPIPALTSLSPTAGYSGTVVTLTGTGLGGATAVTFNGLPATSFTVNSATSITVTVPANATTGPVSVTTPGGTATTYNSFVIIAPPNITSFSPASGGVGSSVVVTGTNFVAGQLSAVAINGRNAPFTVNSATQLTATVPSGATTGPITVTNAGGTATSATNFTVTSAVVTGFAPASGRTGTSVVVTGGNFTGTTNVKFNGLDATFTINSPTQLTAIVPAAATTGPISVIKPGGTDQSSTAFAVTPTITSFSPTSGGIGTTVTITGSGFAGTTSVKFAGYSQAATYSVLSPTTIIATIITSFGPGPIAVTTVGGAATSTGNFTFVYAPTISTFNPAAGVVGATVTLTGTNLTGTTAVRFNGVNASSFTVNSATSITATVPANARTGPVSVTTPGGTATSAGTFTVIGLGVSSITPTAGWLNTRVTINGSNFTGATAVKFNTWSTTNFTVNSTGTAITVYVPTGATTGPVTVTTPSGVVQSLETFGVVPRITSFTPTGGPVGTTVVLTGTGFSPVAANNVVYFGTCRARVTAATYTRLTVVVPAGATYAPPTVTVAGRTGTALRAFNITFSGGGLPTATSFGLRATVGTGTGPTALTAGDLDGDGKPDLVVANRKANTISLLRNVATSGALTNASFAARVDFAVGFQPRGLTLADIDGDGRLDVVVANAASHTVAVLRNLITAPGAFTAASLAAAVHFPTANGPIAVSAGDIDLDGRPEIVAADSAGQAFSVLSNQAAPGVALTAASMRAKVDFSTGASGFYGVSAADLNGDARADIVGASSDNGATGIWKSMATVPGPLSVNSLAGAVWGSSSGSYPSATGTADFDNDGKTDPVFSFAGSKQISVWRNVSTVTSAASNWISGGSGCTAPAAVPAGCLAFGDLDGGGKVDLLGVMPSLNSVAISPNRSGSGSVVLTTTPVTISTGQTPRGVVVADFDGDGRPDLATADYRDNTVSLLRNQTTPPVLTGLTPASGPVGTVVAIDAPDMTDAKTVTFPGGITVPSSLMLTTRIHATVPAGALSGPLTVTFATGVQATTAGSFTVTGPRSQAAATERRASFVVEPRPNPTHDRVTLQLREASGSGEPVALGAVVVTLLDATGHVVRRVPLASAEAEIPLAVPGLAPGLYLVQVAGAGEVPASCRLVIE